MRMFHRWSACFILARKKCEPLIPFWVMKMVVLAELFDYGAAHPASEPNPILEQRIHPATDCKLDEVG
jgi:hypothetical protein